MKRCFLPPDHEQLLFQQYQVYPQGVRLVYKHLVDFMKVAKRDDLQEMVSKFGLKNEVHPQPYNVYSFQDEEELAKQYKSMQDTLKTNSEVIGHLNKEEPILIAEFKEEPKEEEHVSLVPSIDVSSLMKFEDVIPKVVLIWSSAIASQEHQSCFIVEAANLNCLKDSIELSSWETCLVCITINNILVNDRGQILSKIQKDEVVGVDQLKDWAIKFLGHSYIWVFRQT